MRIPFSAPLPVPTMMAVGVARPRAQGQAMTSTATKFEQGEDGMPTPAKNQTMNVTQGDD